MRAHLSYLKYVLRHKYYVLRECIKLGIPWQGIIHDWHKFLPSEWFPYVNHFYNPDGTPKQAISKVGYCKANDMDDETFNDACSLHYKRGKHHWQYWVLQEGKVLPMPLKYRKEMLADWYGAGKAQGGSSVRDWYQANKDKMKLNPMTRLWVEWNMMPNWQWAGKRPTLKIHKE